MSADPKAFFLSTELADYVAGHSSPPDAVLTGLIERTRQLGDVAGMQIAPDQGAFMTLVTQLVQPRLAVEVGTFTGYSSICLARGLPPGGRLIACDLSEEWTAIARAAWVEAGVDDRIDLRIGPAIETLRALPDDLLVDLAFIDADKGGYLDYYEEILRRLRPGGVILVDNVLWSGRVVDATDVDADTAALREFNAHVAADDRVDVVVLTVADGLSLIRLRD